MSALGLINWCDSSSDNKKLISASLTFLANRRQLLEYKCVVTKTAALSVLLISSVYCLATSPVY
jgi:hypothetical protein